ncbi:MAG TPA: methionine aminopeptidase [Lapillicoccus sp.]|nr:methionine aminopeptidase [Lapillicoccus sp.]
MSYWYNTATGQVETDDNRGQAQDVMGPYDTEEEAAHALQSARERTEKWDAEDREWNARGAASEDGED